jgi:hypothetical protein
MDCFLSRALFGENVEPPGGGAPGLTRRPSYLFQRGYLKTEHHAFRGMGAGCAFLMRSSVQNSTSDSALSSGDRPFIAAPESFEERR